MSCYFCGKPGHKKQQCPQRKTQTIKCYECGNYGHYKNECPIIRQQIIEKEQADLKIREQERKDSLQIQLCNDASWIMENIPLDNSKILTDLSVNNIKDFFNNLRNSVTIHLNYQEIKSFVFAPTSIKIYYFENKISSYHENALSRVINGMKLEDFLFFIKQQTIFTMLSYEAIDNSLSGLIYKLAENKAIKEIVTEQNRENEYYIDKKKVMRSRRHSGHWKDHVEKQHATLICETYDNYMNDGKSCIGNSVEFIYTERDITNKHDDIKMECDDESNVNNCNLQ